MYPLEKRNFPVDFVARCFVGFLSGDAVCVDYERAFLARADVGVQLQNLFEGHPDGAAKFCAMALAHKEDAASENGRIRWIDYRVPLTSEGDTLHLHICPAGSYDTGTLACNFVKRGFTHGLRLIGTLKSGPDMNVLLIYEK